MKQLRAARRNAQRGLTLIEILVVVVILGILSTIVAVNVLPEVDRARVRTAETQIAQLESALRQYKLDMAVYPTVDQGLDALVAVPNNLRNAGSYRPGGYLDGTTVPVDPWGNVYQYAYPGEAGAEFDVYSFGPDGRPGGNDDIGSWQ